MMSIFKNLEGDFESWWNGHFKPFLHEDVEPVLKTFIKQFESAFGQQAITAALGAVGSLATGASFGVVATGLATTLYADAKADAAHDATLDVTTVLQTIQSALQVAKAATGTVTAADTAAAATIAPAPAAAS